MLLCAVFLLLLLVSVDPRTRTRANVSPAHVIIILYLVIIQYSQSMYYLLSLQLLFLSSLSSSLYQLFEMILTFRLISIVIRTILLVQFVCVFILNMHAYAYTFTFGNYGDLFELSTLNVLFKQFKVDLIQMDFMAIHFYNKTKNPSRCNLVVIIIIMNIYISLYMICLHFHTLVAVKW